MARYVGQRFLAMIPTLFFISIVGFLIIEVPPGDYFSMYLDQLQRQGVTGAQEQVAAMRVRYGADQPIYKRYFIWLSNFARGDFGNSLIYRKPVRDLIFSRLAMTIVVSFSSLLVIYAIGIPVGIYSATHKYSFGDNLFTFVAVMGLGLPDFLLALVLLVVALKLTGSVPTGL
ncbi:MAG: ABC transporter permease, partial [Chloroflexota bacterium]